MFRSALGVQRARMEHMGLNLQSPPYSAYGQSPAGGPATKAALNLLSPGNSNTPRKPVPTSSPLPITPIK